VWRGAHACRARAEMQRQLETAVSSARRALSTAQVRQRRAVTSASPQERRLLAQVGSFDLSICDL
jgi:hypothetical protein